MRKLDGKIALVTGASKGIGAGIALSLAKEGAAAAVNYASDRAGADRVVEKIKTAGGKAIAVQGSVTSSEEIDRFFSETEKQLGNVDVLVNNAGVFSYLPLQDVNEKEFHRQFDTNVLGLLLRGYLERMLGKSRHFLVLFRIFEFRLSVVRVRPKAAGHVLNGRDLY